MSAARHLGVVGLGLVGASLARAVRARHPSTRLTVVEPREDVRARASADGLADVVLAAPAAPLADCDLVVLCAPIAALEALLAPVSQVMRDGAVLTDVGGVKESVVARARAEVRLGVAFVGAHPMFGGQAGGYAAARPERWQGGTVAVCTDGAEPWAVERVAALHESLGAEVVRCTAAEHDAAAAVVSHLPYVIASALARVADAAGPLAAQLAGPGFADMTRLAGFAFEVQGEVALRNRTLPEVARRFEGELERLLAALGESSQAAKQVFVERRS